MRLLGRLSELDFCEIDNKVWSRVHRTRKQKAKHELVACAVEAYRQSDR